MANYAEKLKDPRWQKKRLEIMSRDKWACTSCGDGKSQLHVHHEKYKGDPWEAQDKHLKTLCEDCHSIEHGKNITSADLAVKKLLEIKAAICEPLKLGLPAEKETEILKAAMKIDQSMIRIRRVNG